MLFMHLYLLKDRGFYATNINYVNLASRKSQVASRKKRRGYILIIYLILLINKTN